LKPGNGRLRIALERPEERFEARRAVARVAFERLAGGFEGFGARQAAGLNAFKIRDCRGV